MIRKTMLKSRFPVAIAAAWLLGIAGITGAVLSSGCGDASKVTSPTTTTGTGTGTASSRDAIDPTTVKWLIGQPLSMTVSNSVDFKITSFTDHDTPTICYKANTPSWYGDSSGITNGSLYVIINENGTWYGAGIEYNLSGTDGRCSTMENYAGEPPFIQGKIAPVSTTYPKSGDTVYFMLTTLIPEWQGGAGPQERSPIVKAIFP
jgi:hypothetical protein